MINDLRNRIFTRESSGHASMLHKSVFLIGVKTASAAFGFFITLVLARVLGAEEYGHYTYAFTWISVISLVAVCGFDRLLIREFSKWRTEGKDALLMACYKATNSWVVLAAIGCTAVAFGLSFLPFEVFDDPKTKHTYQLALLSVPIIALINHRKAALNGLREVVISQFPDKLVQPGILLLVLLLLLLLPEGTLQAETAIGVNIASWGVAFLVAHWMWRNKRPTLETVKPQQGEQKRWWKAALVILLFNLSMITFSKLDVLMLRPMQDAEAVGIYNIAFKLSAYLNFILIAFNGVIAPSIAQYHTEKNKAQLQLMVTKMVRYSMLLATPMALVLIFGHPYYLPLFGEEFQTAGFAIVWMTCGQMINIAMGPVGNLLIMTNNEGAASLCFVISTLANATLNYFLIPTMGFEGAAIATAISLALNNVLMLIVVGIQLKINPTVLKFG